MKIRIGDEAYCTFLNLSADELEKEICLTEIAVNSRPRRLKDAIDIRDYKVRLSVLKLFLQLKKGEITIEEIDGQVTSF